MNLGIATDVTNQNFSGAIQNPDSALSVEFYYHEPVDTWASHEKGVPVKLPKMPFVRIATPGKDDCIVERPASGRDAERFPVQWMRFQMANGLVEADKNLPGWHIQDWLELNEDQVRFLQFARFQTVEQIAGASDHQVAAIGMGGAALREKARQALRMKMDSAVTEEIAKRDAKIAEQEERLQKLEAMLVKPERETLHAKK